MIYLIYPHKKLKSAPNIIGYKLYNFLRKKYQVQALPHNGIKKISPNEGDILIGHPDLIKVTSFGRSINSVKWRRVVLIHPFNHDWDQVSYLERYIDKVDSFLAISGKYWHKSISDQRIKRWLPKIIQLDMAVDPEDFPKIKYNFSAVGLRKFVYIGNMNPGKNTDFLRKISIMCPNVPFFHIGPGVIGGKFIELGYMNFSSDEARKRLSEFDFFITVGTYDANPTTILESICWGLIPVCTKTSGYENEPGIINIDGVDINKAINTINYLNHVDYKILFNLQKKGFENIQKNYSWTSFFATVEKELFSKSAHLLDEKNNDLDYSERFPISRMRIYKAFILVNIKSIIRYFYKNQDKDEK